MDHKHGKIDDWENDARFTFQVPPDDDTITDVMVTLRHRFVLPDASSSRITSEDAAPQGHCSLCNMQTLQIPPICEQSMSFRLTKPWRSHFETHHAAETSIEMCYGNQNQCVLTNCIDWLISCFALIPIAFQAPAAEFNDQVSSRTLESCITPFPTQLHFRRSAGRSGQRGTGCKRHTRPPTLNSINVLSSRKVQQHTASTWRGISREMIELSRLSFINFHHEKAKKNADSLGESSMEKDWTGEME